MPVLELDLPKVRAHLVRFLREAVEDSGFSRVVLGLSGGIDSALAAAIAAEALGPENVLGLEMPWRTSSASSLEDADAVADYLGIQVRRIEITRPVEELAALLPEPSPLRLGNVMARVRMICIFDAAAETAALPLGTSNKSELLLGYGTWYGDLASAINPLGDLYKTQVFALAREYELPASVIEKAPSADLEEGQTDEDDLGWEYSLIDQILLRYADLRWTREHIKADGLPADAVDTLLDRVSRQHFKRLTPVIPKISPRTFNLDWLYRRDAK